MQVRPAKRSDLPSLILLADQFHSEDPAFSSTPFDASIVLASFDDYLKNENCCLFVTEQHGQLTGFFMGHVSRSAWGQFREAGEDFFYVTPDSRGTGAGDLLVQSYVEWAKEKGALITGTAIRSQINANAVSLLLDRNGFVPMGTLWVYRGS
ncbi:MAG: GNAT family N-acetyltransferase [Gammaproteobacteria bacterium]|nr:GNAT family N-acetyltransferase [Gammaproteobacteria bacterium]